MWRKSFEDSTPRPWQRFRPQPQDLVSIHVISWMPWFASPESVPWSLFRRALLSGTLCCHLCMSHYRWHSSLCTAWTTVSQIFGLSSAGCQGSCHRPATSRLPQYSLAKASASDRVGPCSPLHFLHPCHHSLDIFRSSFELSDLYRQQLLLSHFLCLVDCHLLFGRH